MDTLKDTMDHTMSRRRFLAVGGGTALLWLLGTTKALAWIRPTVPNIEGPFHRNGAPFRTRLASPQEPGQPLTIRGQVLNVDGKPLAGATLDVWHADAKGHYDNDDPAHPPAPNSYKLRGQMKTDAQGRYEFETIMPARYQTDPDVWRPAHIHFIISQPGYVPLTTQLYFKGDPYLKSDPWARDTLVIDLQGAGGRGPLSGTFNIVLEKPAN